MQIEKINQECCDICSIWVLVSKVALFLVQYATMRLVGVRRARRMIAAANAAAAT